MVGANHRLPVYIHRRGYIMNRNHILWYFQLSPMAVILHAPACVCVSKRDAISTLVACNDVNERPTTTWYVVWPISILYTHYLSQILQPMPYKTKDARIRSSIE